MSAWKQPLKDLQVRAEKAKPWGGRNIFTEHLLTSAELGRDFLEVCGLDGTPTDSDTPSAPHPCLALSGLLDLKGTSFSLTPASLSQPGNSSFAHKHHGAPTVYQAISLVQQQTDAHPCFPRGLRRTGGRKTKQKKKVNDTVY